MFGITWGEFLVILLGGVLVIPARLWPDVGRFLAFLGTFVRKLGWEINAAAEQIRKQNVLEKPIDDLIRTTTADMLDGISEPLGMKKKTGKKAGRVVTRTTTKTKKAGGKRK